MIWTQLVILMQYHMYACQDQASLWQMIYVEDVSVPHGPLLSRIECCQLCSLTIGCRGVFYVDGECQLNVNNIEVTETNKKTGKRYWYMASQLPIKPEVESKNVPDVPDVSDVPDVPDVSDVPDVPDVSDVSNVPDVSDVSDVLDVSNVSDVSLVPQHFTTLNGQTASQVIMQEYSAFGTGRFHSFDFKTGIWSEVPRSQKPLIRQYAYDANRGRLFWTFGRSIMWAHRNRLGEAATFHSEGSHILGVCIDTRVDRLFFTRGGPSFDIMSTDLEKPEPRIVLQDKTQIFEKYSSMDVDTYNKRLYAVQFALGKILSCDYDGGNSHVHVIGLPTSILTYWPKVQKLMLQIGKVLWTYGPDTFKRTVYYRLRSLTSKFLITQKWIVLFGRKRCFVLSENKTRVKINVIFPPEAFIHKSIII